MCVRARVWDCVKIRPFRYGNFNFRNLEIFKNFVKVKIRPFRYGNSCGGEVTVDEDKSIVKIRPFRYGNLLSSKIHSVINLLKSDRFGMEIRHQ